MLSIKKKKTSQKNILFFDQADDTCIEQSKFLAKALKQNFNTILLAMNNHNRWKYEWPYDFVNLTPIFNTLFFEEFPNLLSFLNTESQYIDFFEIEELQREIDENTKLPPLLKKKLKSHAAYLWKAITIAAITLWKPQGIFVRIPCFSSHKIVADTCFKLNYPFYTVENGTFPGAIEIDKGYYQYSTNSINDESYQDIFNIISEKKVYSLAIFFLDDYKKNKITSVEQPKKIKSSQIRQNFLKNKKTFLLSYVCQNSSNHFHDMGNPQFASDLDAITFLVKTVKNYPRIQVLVKRHPFDPGSPTEEIQAILGSHGTVISDVHIHSLLEASDCIVMRNSSVAFETICYSKPLIMFEKSRFNIPKLVYHSNNETDLNNILQTLLLQKKQTPTNKKCLYQLIGHLLINYYLPQKKCSIFSLSKSKSSNKSLDLRHHFSLNTTGKKLRQQLLSNQLPSISEIPNLLRIIKLLQTSLTIHPITYNKVMHFFTATKISFKTIVGSYLKKRGLMHLVKRTNKSSRKQQ